MNKPRQGVYENNVSPPSYTRAHLKYTCIIAMATLHLFPFHVQLLACKLLVAMVIYSNVCMYIVCTLTPVRMHVALTGLFVYCGCLLCVCVCVCDCVLHTHVVDGMHITLCMWWSGRSNGFNWLVWLIVL